MYSYAGSNPIAYTDPFGLQGTPRAMRECAQNPTPSCQTCTRGVRRNILRIGTALGREGVATIAPAIITAGVAAVPLAVRGAAGINAAAGLEGQGARYVGQAEARAITSSDGVIPATNAAGEARAIHFTADAPISSASAATATYNLPATPTHVVTFPLSNLRGIIPGTGESQLMQPKRPHNFPFLALVFPSRWCPEPDAKTSEADQSQADQWERRSAGCPECLDRGQILDRWPVLLR